MKKTPAIVLGCHKIGLGIIRALGIAGVPVIGVYYNDMDMGYASRYIIAHYKCPHPDKDDNAFVSFLIDLSSKWAGCVIIPSDDASLIPLAKHKTLLEKYYRVSACNWEVTEKVIKKKHTYAIADKIGVPCPKTSIPGTLEEAISFVKSVGLPCILKPIVGHIYFEKFKRKMLYIQNLNQLRNIYESGEIRDIEMMLQEFIPGDDTCGANYNSFFINEDVQIEVTAEKVRLSPPKIGFPTVIVSKHIPEIIEPGRKIIRGIGFKGFSCIEFKKDIRNGIYKLMEINGRQNLSTPLSVKSGINFPYMTYQYVLNGEIPKSQNSFKEGIYWIDMGKDVVESLRGFKKEKLYFHNLFKPYLKPHVFAVMSMHDPLPVIKRYINICLKLFKTIFSNTEYR